MAPGDGTSEAVFALEDQLYNHSVLAEGMDTYSAVHVNLDMITCDVERELLDAFRADFAVVLVIMEEFVAHREL